MNCSECGKELDRHDRWIVPVIRRKSQCSEKCAKKAWKSLGLPKPRMGMPKYVYLPKVWEESDAVSKAVRIVMPRRS